MYHKKSVILPVNSENIQISDYLMGTDSPRKIIGTDSQVLFINRAGNRRK